MPPAPVTPRASTILEPPRLEIGDTAVVEIAVATPPGFEVEPPAPPEAVPGLWILEAERARVEREPARWLHRARFRVRARETGRFTWPATRLEVRDRAGEPQALEAPARPFEVVSLLDEGSAPEGLRAFRVPTPEAAGNGLGPAWAALAGALAALAAVGLVLLVRGARRAEASRRAGEGAAALPGLVGPWRAARAALERAEARAGQDPIAAADLAAGAVRSLAARRIDPALLKQTTEELPFRPAPATLESAWAELLPLLRALDGVRFAPDTSDRDTGDAAPASPGLQALLARARVLVDQLGPRGSAR